MKKSIRILISLSFILGSLVLGACSEASIDELEDRVAEALNKGNTEDIQKYGNKESEKERV